LPSQLFVVMGLEGQQFALPGPRERGTARPPAGQRALHRRQLRGGQLFLRQRYGETTRRA